MWMTIWTYLLDRMPLWLLRHIPPACRWSEPPNLPPIVYTDESGVGWTRAPDYQEAWSEDIGQHDTWKREMRLAYLRWTRKEYDMGGADLRDYGLSASPRRVPIPPLFPLHTQLAEACRRLGFMQLFISANPDATAEDANRMWEEQEAVAQETADTRYNARVLLKSTWDEVARGPCDVTPYADILRLLSVGPFEGFPLPVDPATRSPRLRAPLLPLEALAHAATPERFMRTK